MVETSLGNYEEVRNSKDLFIFIFHFISQVETIFSSGKLFSKGKLFYLRGNDIPGYFNNLPSYLETLTWSFYDRVAAVLKARGKQTKY